MERHRSYAGRGAAAAPKLLRWGVVAGPFYLAVGLVQALVRDGFDLARHPLSVLANGPGGWVQTANFVLTGLMVLAAAAGFGRLAGRTPLAAAWCLAGFGVAMVVAAVFPADPVDGFPPGTPEGFPTSISTTGLVHFIVGALGFTCLALSGLFAAWTMWRRNAYPLVWAAWPAETCRPLNTRSAVQRSTFKAREPVRCRRSRMPIGTLAFVY
jgi:hypothetical protein